MGRCYDTLDDALVAFLSRQRVFFVATAPLSSAGHVNLSPKGLDTFAVLDPRRVAWLDLGGSGVETIAHLRENGRITMLFCAFEGPPRIVRLHGRGVAHPASTAAAEALAARFPSRPYHRAVIEVTLERVADSCGYGVPRYRFAGDRPQLDAWAAKKGEAGVRAYRRKHDLRSIDGLPALELPDLAPAPSPGDDDAG